MAEQELMPATNEEKGITQSQENHPASTDPMQMIANAVAQGADPDNIQKLMDLAERHERNQAKRDFVQAMAQFKANAPRIIKDKEQGHTKTKYASLAEVVSKITEKLSEFGLSHNWTTSQEGKVITVTCTLTHRSGHSESTSLSAEPDTSGSKNAIQAIGSTVTYLERYTLLAATGVAAHEQDDDGAAAGKAGPKPEKDWYPEEKFDASWPTWKEKIESGEKTKETLKSMLRSKYTLTDEQLKAIDSAKEPEVSGDKDE